MASVLQRHYVRDLKTWDLPRLEDLEERLVEEFGAKARVVFLDGERSGGQLHALFLDRLRELASTAVNEVLEYWLRGLVDGCNGQFPELCVELPFLERAEGGDALALAYCVDNEDGSRTELNRVTLNSVLRRVLDGIQPVDVARVGTVARELRALAGELERHARLQRA